jgi:hypothetical protein
MRRIKLSLCLALALSGLTYSGAQAASLACAVGMNVHNHAWILLHHHRLAQCVSGAAGCKCVSCYNWAGAVYSTCYSLVAPIPR